MYFLQDQKCSKKSYIKLPTWGLQIKRHKVTHDDPCQSKLHAINKLNKCSAEIRLLMLGVKYRLLLCLVYCVLCSVTPAWLIISSALVSCCYTAVWLCLILILVLGHSNEDELVQTSTRGYCNPIAYSVELSTKLREVSQCPNKAPTRAFSLLKVPSSSFKNKNLLRHYAKQAFKHGK